MTFNGEGHSVACPTCGARPGEHCESEAGKKRSAHPARRRAAYKLREKT